MLISIESLDDPRLDPYRSLKGQDTLRRGTRFIAEGIKVVERLLASSYETESLLVVERRASEWENKAPQHIPIYVVPESCGEQLVGFNFHVGVLACGRRKPVCSFEQLIANLPESATIVICPFCDNPENLGAIFRIARAFGVHSVWLGPQCCDPLSRRVLRVSMGNALEVPFRQTNRLMEEVEELRTAKQFQFVATVLDPRAAPLHRSNRSPRLGVMFGNEADGLSSDCIERCDQRVTIPMSGGTDSLNVAIAAGIFLHHYCRQSDIVDN